MRQRLLGPTAGFKQFASFVRYDDFRPLTSRNMIFDLICKVVDIHHTPTARTSPASHEQMLSADNITAPATEAVEQAPTASVLSADNTVRATGPATLSYQSAPVQDLGTTTPAQLVRALGRTADEQAATLRAGLGTEALHALMEALHSQV